jgi:hypothetical protein
LSKKGLLTVKDSMEFAQQSNRERERERDVNERL